MCGNHPCDRQRREDEDGEDQRHGQEDGLRIVAAWVPELVDVHGVDLDAGVGEEAVDDQDDAGEPIPRRQEVVGGHRRRGWLPWSR